MKAKEKWQRLTHAQRNMLIRDLEDSARELESVRCEYGFTRKMCHNFFKIAASVLRAEAKKGA